jgi:hypothetical protein
MVLDRKTGCITVGSLFFERDFGARVRLDADVEITNELVVGGGVLELGEGLLTAGAIEVVGGRLEGTSGALRAGNVVVRAGIFLTARGLSRIRSLHIRPPGSVRIGVGGRLEIYGDSEPLSGEQFLHVNTNGSVSVESTGRLDNQTPTSRVPGRKSLAFGDAPTLLTLDPGEHYVGASVVDTTAGFAYLAVPGDADYPSSIIKIRLSDLTRVGTLVLPSSDGAVASAAIDPGAGFGYFGTRAAPGRIVRVRLSDFSRVDALTLAAGENDITALAIDAVSGFAFAGTNTTPGIIAKVRLSDFTQTAARTLLAGENGISAAALDPAGSFGIFAFAGGISKVRLSDLFETTSSRIRNALLSDLSQVAQISGLFGVQSATIDEHGEYLYLGRDVYGTIEKIRLADFTPVATVTLPRDESRVTSTALDPSRSTLLVAVTTPPAKLVRIDLTGFQRRDALALRTGEDDSYCSVIDESAGFAYFGTYTEPGMVVKVRLPDFARVGALTLEPGENGLTSAVIDSAAGFAYFGTYTDPGAVVKIRLSDFTRVAAVTLQPLESYLTSAAIDTAAGSAYFGASPVGAFGLVTKLRLSDFTRVSSLAVAGPNDPVSSMVIDPAGGYLYTGSVGTISRVHLSNFSPAASLTSGATSWVSAAMDPAGGYAYFATADEALTSDRLNKVARIRLVDFKQDGGLAFWGTGFPYVALLDSIAGRAFFGLGGTSSFGFPILSVRLEDFEVESTFRFFDFPSPLSTRYGIRTGVLDRSTRVAYLGLLGAPSRIARVDLSTGSRPTATVAGGGSFCPGATGFFGAYLSGIPPWSVTWSDGVVQANLMSSPVGRAIAVAGDAGYSIVSVSDSRGPGTSTGVATFSALPTPVPPLITAPPFAPPGAVGLIASVPDKPGTTYSWTSTPDTITSNPFANQVTFTQSADPVTLQVWEGNSFSCFTPSLPVTIPLSGATPALALNTLPPCRLFDTRSASPPTGVAPALDPVSVRVFRVSGLCGIPSTTTALSVNVTVTQPAAAGSLSLFAGNEPMPLSATTISFGPGQTRAANTIVRLASDGSETIRVLNTSSGTVHFILDVNGYFE